MELKDRLVGTESLINQVSHMEAVTIEAQEKYRRKVNGLRASTEEVEAWYYASDPLDLIYYLRLDLVLADHNHEELKNVLEDSMADDLAMGRGGLTLLCSVLFKDEFSEEAGDPNLWADRVFKTHYQPLAEEGKLPEADLPSATGLMKLCLEEINERDQELLISDIPVLFMAAEMMRQSTVSLLDGFESKTYGFAETKEEVTNHIKNNQLVPKAQVILTGLSIDQLNETLSSQGHVSDVLLAYIAEFSSFDPEQDDLPDEAFDEIRMLALKANALLCANWLAADFTDLKPGEADKGQQAFMLMVESMFSLFNGYNGNPITKRLKSPQVKGSLHEILWLLDAHVMRRLDPEKYEEVKAYPSYSHIDAPRIGYPEQKHNVDLTLTKGRIQNHLQLKSSPRKGEVDLSIPPEMLKNVPEKYRGLEYASKAEYHPGIWVIHEPNFMEVDPRRLTSKLVKYLDWAKSGFDPERAQNISKYVMQSVRWQFETIGNQEIGRVELLRKLLGRLVIEPYVQDKNRPSHEKPRAPQKDPKLVRSRRKIERASRRKNRSSKRK